MSRSSSKKIYEVQCAESFFAQLSRSPAKVRKIFQKTALKRLRNNPTDTGTDVIKKLKYYKNLWRYRMGNDWRLIYEVDEGSQSVTCLMLGLRDKIYDSGLGIKEHGLSVAIVADPVVGELLEHKPTPHERGEALVKQAAIEINTEPEGEDEATLPEAVTHNLLRELNIPAKCHPRLLEVKTEGDLLECEADVPGNYVETLMDYFWPPNIKDVTAKPVRIIDPNDDEKLSGSELTLESLLLKLDDNQKTFVSQFEDSQPIGPWILKGGPGSGKSTVALHCIRGLLRQGSNSLPLPGAGIRILFTTFTHSLVASANHLIKALGRDNSQHDLVVINVDGLARAHAPKAWKNLSYLKTKSPIETELIIKAIDASRQQENDFPFTIDDTRFLMDEIDWVILGDNLTREEQYHQADRTGRGRRLGKAQRHFVWLFWHNFENQLRENKRFMLTQRMLGALENVEAEFDYVFIDEAQDLKPAAIKLCLGLAKDPRNVFVTADTNQTIYGSGIKWSKMSDSLDFRGRSRILRRNYRTNREIWAAIKPIADGLKDIDRETLDSEPVFPGDIPMLAQYTTPDDEIDVINQWLTQTLLRERLTPSHAAVLCATNKDCARIAKRLESRLNPRQLTSKEMDLGHPGVKVMTMHAAKGLQFSVVAVTGLKKGKFPWKHDKSMDEQEHLDKNQRLFFVACSRAMRRLLVCHHREWPSPYIELLDKDQWEDFEE